MKEETPPELSIAERIGEAARQVNKADQHATTIAKQLYDLECQDSLSLGNFGEITGCSAIGGTTDRSRATGARPGDRAQFGAAKFHALRI